MSADMREKAWALLKQYNAGEYRFFHALCVESAMRAFAQRQQEDPEYWGAVGLLHDVDFEVSPGAHCKKNEEILRTAGYGDAFIRAVQSHGYGTNTDVEPLLFMEKVLYTLNELVSLVSDCAMDLPSQSIYDLTAEKVVSMFPVEGYALKARRSTIAKGCQMLGMMLTQVVEITICGMQKDARALGLEGNGHT